MTKKSVLSIIAALVTASAPIDVLGAQIKVAFRYPGENIPDGAGLAVRGSGCSGLNWTSGIPLELTSQDTFTTTLSCGTGPVQFKSLVGDADWQIGANEVIASPEDGTSVVVYPWFYTQRGTVETLSAGLWSPQLNDSRPVVTYLPPSYAENYLKPVADVLIMHDGQNLFFSNTSFGGVPWAIQDTIDELIVEGGMREVLVLGAWNTGANRINEYTYSYNKTYGGGEGDLYLDFLEKQLLPLARKTYRIPSDLPTSRLGILGSSLGGLISCYAGFTRPTTYGIVGCMSSSFWWNNEDFLNVVLKRSEPPASTLYYVDSGTEPAPDGDDELQTIAVRNALQGMGFKTFYYLDQGGAHSERYWGARFHVPMTNLYAPLALVPT